MSVEISRTGIEVFQSTAHADGDLLIWTIYDHPKDFPDDYVVRPHSTKLEKPMPVHFRHEQLAYVRRALRRLGLVCIARSPGDDPCILESWL